MPEDELSQLRTRVYKIADQWHDTDKAISAHELRIIALEAALGKGATSIELSNAVAMLTLKLDPLQKDIETIKKALYWAVGSVLFAVAMAVLALVLKP